MSAVINLEGIRFGKLLVIKRNGSNIDRKAIWECFCDCGIIVNKTGKYLKKAKELYCGDMHPTKVCTKCKVEKNKLTDYHKCGGKSKSINPVCKKCITEINFQNKEIINATYHAKIKDANERDRVRRNVKKSWLRNKHKDLPYKRKYNKRPEVIERRKKIHKDRKENDMQYAIKRRLRGRVRDCLKSMIGNSYKYKSSLVMLGCDIPFFKEYLESKFQKGMNWQRFAYIHIDHIKPCSQFDLTKVEEQMKCFHYSNMQPLWEVDNLLKSYKYNGD